MTASQSGSGQPVRLGPYRLEEPLGSGGMGKVWRAWDERLQRRVALKELRPDAAVANVRERLRREARAAARLNHPAIVHVYDIVQGDSDAGEGDWIVMELVEGTTLRRLIEKGGPLDPAAAVRVGREIAEGLAEAHSHGILHRDLKAANVMVTPAGRVKILDFGLAKDLAVDGEAREATLSAPGTILGTCHAMSPEQVMGEPLDVRSDLFSLGSLLYEVLTGRPPFLGETPTASLARVLTFRPPPLARDAAGVPSDLSGLLDRLLEKDPALRPQSAREVADALAVLGSAAATGAVSAGASRPEPVVASSGLSGSPVSGSAAAWTLLPAPELPSASLSLPTLDQRPWAPPPIDASQAGAGAVAPAVSPAQERSGETGLRSTERRRQMGERRLVSVVCCGLVGMEEDGGEVGFLDVETLSEALPPVLDLARRTAARLDGQLAAAMGHQLWLYFGYPQAHEDDAERAVRAARELVEGADGLGIRCGPASRRRLAARAAVHTGPAAVVIRPGATGPAGAGQEDQPQLGSTLDLATGLLSAAPAGGVVVSAASQRLIARGFATAALPPARLPGIDEPVPLFRVGEALEGRAGEDGGPEAPLIGRDRELELLFDRFRLARSGHGQAVMIGGEPGIGKSRLLRALRQRLAAEAEAPRPLWIAGQGSAYTQSSPLVPAIEVLERIVAAASSAGAAGDQGSSGAVASAGGGGLGNGADRLERLEGLLLRHGLPLQEQIPLLAPLLGVPDALAESRYPQLALLPEVRRQRTLESVVGLLAQVAERRTLVLALEDLHWVDPSTLELLDLLMADIAALPVLLVMTFRPGFQAPWGHRANVTQLSLAHLSGGDTEALVQALAAAGHPLPPEVLRQIVEKTDGVPLFVEELTRTVLEAGGREPGRGLGIDLPSTLDASLAARLDRLGPAREVAQLASVIGRTFTLDLLAAVSPLERGELQAGLDELLRAELVYRRGVGARARYLFKHALVQDAAYASLLGRDRQALHLALARALESGAASPAGAEPAAVPTEVVAHHYTAGGDAERAWEAWLHAGQSALGRFALAEAVEHLRQSLAALQGLPAQARPRHEIASQSLLGVALSLLRGHAAAEVEAAYGRVLELGEQLGALPDELYPGLWAFYNARADLQRASQLAGQMLQNAEAQGEPGPLSLALCAWATTQAFRGELAAARQAFERSLALSPPDSAVRVASSLGFDPRVLALGQLGQISWITGRPDTALAQCRQARDLAQGLGDPVSIALAVLLLGHLELTARDHAAAREHALALQTIARENAFHSWGELADLELGCAEAGLAATRDEALPALEGAQRAFDVFRATHGHDLDIGRNAAWLIEAGVRHGWIEQGEALLARTETTLERTGERYWDPELHRLRGVLALERGGEGAVEEAKSHFRQALAAAGRLGALAMELRAAVALARLLRESGRGEEGREILAEVRGRFTEGEGTVDLREAGELLAELGRPGINPRATQDGPDESG